MTRQSNLKKKIRARMEKTGERYTTARAHVLADGGARASLDGVPGRVRGYDLVGGGSQADTAAQHNVLLAAGARGPDDEPWSDAMIYGLGGGVGFLYALFEYQGHDPMLSVGVRYTMMGNELAGHALSRMGVKTRVVETRSAKKAAAELDKALDEERAVLLTVDDVTLPYSGLPEAWRGMSAQQVGVVGRDEANVWLDDRTLTRVSRAELAAARASYKKAKHRMVVVEGAGEVDLPAAVKDAVTSTARNFVECPYKGFVSNWGFAGMEKWARMCTDDKDKKGWPRMFSTPRLARLALTRVTESVERGYTAASAGRGVYADFLEESSRLAGLEGLADAAERYRELAARWSALSEAATAGEAMRPWRAATAAFDRALVEDGEASAERRRALFAARREEIDGAALSLPEARSRFAAIADAAREIVALERAAMEAARAAVG
jgi:hypothetical protein